MKKLVLLTSLFYLGLPHAQADRLKGDIVCSFAESSYGLSSAKLEIVKQTSIMSEKENENGAYVISLSESECEDSTIITIEEKKDVALYKAGKVFEASVSHETPDVNIEGYATCQVKK